MRNLLASFATVICLATGPAAYSADPPLKVAVLENSPPMSFRDADGRLTGFSVEIARALSAEMQVQCEFQATVMSLLLDALASAEPGQRGLRVAVVKGSAQETYARKQNWDTVGVPTNGELGAPLIAGVAQAAVVPMNTSLNLQKNADFRRLALASTVMTVPELVGNASFSINPRHPELKTAVDDALEHIERNGVYERINTQFLPFRVH